MDNTIQHQLINQCRQNNQNAQLRLYQLYSEAMFHIAYRLLGNTHDAEDAMQEAFIKAFQMIHQFRGEVTFGAWLKKIVINKSLDAIKRRQKRLPVEDLSGLETVADESDWEVDNSVSIEDIKKAILQLTDKYRNVVMLYLIEGYRHEEISEILDITIIASRTRLMRGKQRLKSILKQKCYG